MIKGLDSAVYDILDFVETKTGKGFEFVQKPDLQTYAAIKMARANMPKHIVQYKTEHSDILNHLITHECGHIIRLFNASPDKRIMPGTSDATKEKALTEMQDEIIQLNKKIGFERVVKIVNMWYTGIVNQLTNFPPDYMIEKWIYKNYPSLRPYQKQSIDKQFNDAIQGLKPEIRTLTPAKIYDSSNLMNYAFFRLIGLMIGKNYVKAYGSNIDLQKGKKLAKMIADSPYDNYENDIHLINEWAGYLEISDWFVWVPFETIPDNYLQE